MGSEMCIRDRLTIAKGYKGYDPEGDVSSYYPVTQVYTFGVDIKF